MTDSAGRFINGSCVLEDLEDPGRLTPEFWDYDLQGAAVEAYIRTALQLLLVLTALPLNIYVIMRILRKKLYSEPTYLLLLNLACTDLLLSLVSILFNIAMGFTGHYSFGKTDYIRCQVCKIASLFLVFYHVTIFNMALLSLDRCFFFSRPLKYPNEITVKRTVIALVAIWAVSIAINIPPLAGYGDIGYSISCGFIFTSHRHIQRSYFQLALTGLAFTIAYAVLIVTNAIILQVVRKQTKASRIAATTSLEMQGSTPEKQQQARAMRAKKARRQCSLCRTFLGIMFVNFITIVPAAVLVLTTVFTHDIHTWYYNFVLLCIASQVSLHPLVEAFFTPQIRIKVLKHCKRCSTGEGEGEGEEQWHCSKPTCCNCDVLCTRALEHALS